MMMNGFVTFAQQDPHFSHFMFNQMYYNPGYTAIEGVSRATLIHRSQWLGYQSTNPSDGGGAPSTQSLNVNYPFKLMGASDFNSGVGLSVINDRLGPVHNVAVKANFSYNVDFHTGVLGAGLGFGFWNQRIDASVLRPNDDGDVIIDGLGGGNSSQMKPDLSLGLWYKTKKYEIGLSMRHIIPSGFRHGISSDSITNQLKQHLYLNGLYNFYTGTDLLISPMMMIYTDFSELSVNYGAMVSYRDMKYWGGVTLRQSTSKTAGDSRGSVSNNDVVVLIGMSFMKEKQLRVGYSIDIVTGGAKAKSGTSHELMLSYVLPVGGDDKKPPLRTPRYRHVN